MLVTVLIGCVVFEDELFIVLHKRMKFLQGFEPSCRACLPQLALRFTFHFVLLIPWEFYKIILYYMYYSKYRKWEKLEKTAHKGTSLLSLDRYGYEKT